MRSLLDLRDPPLEYPSPSYPSPPAMKFNTTLVVEDLDLPLDARLVLDLDRDRDRVLLCSSPFDTGR